MNNSNMACVPERCPRLMEEILERMKTIIDACGQDAVDVDGVLFGNDCYMSQTQPDTNTRFNPESQLGQMEQLISKLLTLRAVLDHIREAI